jgi:hypothetical protein
MYGVWRKTRLPHHNRQRKTLQHKKANALNRILVTPCKMPQEKRKISIKKTKSPFWATAKKGICGCGATTFCS